MTDLTDILAAMHRAQRQGTTDEDEARVARAKALSHAIVNAIAQPQFGQVPVGDLLKVLATITGFAIRDNRPAGPISGAIIAAEIAGIILDLATD